MLVLSNNLCDMIIAQATNRVERPVNPAYAGITGREQVLAYARIPQVCRALRRSHIRVFEKWKRIDTPWRTCPLTWDAFQAQVHDAFEAYKSRQRTLHEMVHDHCRWNMVWLGAYPDLVRKTAADFWEVEFTRIDNLDHALPWEDRLRPPR